MRLPAWFLSRASNTNKQTRTRKALREEYPRDRPEQRSPDNNAPPSRFGLHSFFSVFRILGVSASDRQAEVNPPTDSSALNLQDLEHHSKPQTD